MDNFANCFVLLVAAAKHKIQSFRINSTNVTVHTDLNENAIKDFKVQGHKAHANLKLYNTATC